MTAVPAPLPQLACVAVAHPLTAVQSLNTLPDYADA